MDTPTDSGDSERSKSIGLVWRAIAIGSLLSNLICFGLAVDADRRVVAAETKCESLETLAERCDHALLTCVSWQSRVSYELEYIAKRCL